MLFALALALVAVAGGALASYLYDDDVPPVLRLAYGAASGLVALGLVGFILANLVGIDAATIGAAIVVALPGLLLARSPIRQRLSRDLHAIGHDLGAAARNPGISTVGPIVYAVVLVVFLWVVFARVIVEHDGMIFTGYGNNLGDLPFHMQVTSSFAYGQNFPPEDPTYAGTGFAYPYMSDFVSAMFMRAGATLNDAFLIGNLALGLALVGMLHRFTRVLTSDRLAAYIAPILVLFSGGLGWVLFVGDAIASEHGLIGTLADLPRDYTLAAEGYRWGNAITTLLVTQRSLLFGLPIALIVFVLLWKLVHLEPHAGTSIRARLLRATTENKLALAGGLLTGSLPLVHAHSFAVVFGTAFLIGLLFRQWREGRWVAWSIYVVAALALALPQIWWSTHDSIANAGTFFGFEFGWDHGTDNILWFWFVNTGLFVPLAALAAFGPWRPRIASRDLLLLTAIFGIWFIVPNVMKLAPWIWDNIKVLFYWFIGFAPLVALLLSRLLGAGKAWRAAGVAALIALTLAGGIDVWRALSGKGEYQEFDRDGVAVAAIIRAETPPRALILHAPTYNPPVFLTGRRSLLGYTGYIWAHGLPFTDREADIKRIYAGEAGADQLIDRYGIDYILVSPLERGSMTVNDAFFDQFAMVGQSGDYRLYAVTRP